MRKRFQRVRSRESDRNGYQGGQSAPQNRGERRNVPVDTKRVNIDPYVHFAIH